jgi:hypothetical protein
MAAPDAPYVPAGTPPPRGNLLKDLFTIERPPPQTPAVRRLRMVVLLTAVATVLVDLVNLEYAAEGGFGLAVRTIWALLRALGFLFLVRTIRYGRVVSRPFGLILAATTVFAVGRLVVPREGTLLPPMPVLIGFAVLALLCAAVIWQLFRSPEIAAHLSRTALGSGSIGTGVGGRRPRTPRWRRQIPVWVLTARIAGLSLSALLLVPCLVAIGTLFDEPRLPRAVAIPVVVGWLVGTLALGFVAPWIMIFVMLGKRWARVVFALVTIVVLAAGPVLCWWLLGVDGLLRDGVPLVIAAAVCLYGLRAAGRP